MIHDDAGGEDLAWMVEGALGSVEVVADASGNPRDQLRYDPIGRRTMPGTMNLAGMTSAPGGHSEGFTGHEHDDELELINMRGRMYSPRIGRFLSADPLVHLRIGAEGLNPYSYGGNSPTNYRDPTGYELCDGPCPNGDPFFFGGPGGPPAEGGSGDAGGRSDGDSYAERFDRARVASPQNQPAPPPPIANATARTIGSGSESGNDSPWEALWSGTKKGIGGLAAGMWRTATANFRYASEIPDALSNGEYGYAMFALVAATTPIGMAVSGAEDIAGALSGLPEVGARMMSSNRNVRLKVLAEVVVPMVLTAGVARMARVGRVGPRAGSSIRNVNPTRRLSSAGRTENCVNCAVATDATLAGRPATALPTRGPLRIRLIERHFGRMFGRLMSIEAVTSNMQAAGRGARGVIDAPRGRGKVGHVFNVVNQRGTIRFLDGQTGTVARLQGYVGFRLLRTN